jgi:hypothetical protein
MNTLNTGRFCRWATLAAMVLSVQTACAQVVQTVAASAPSISITPKAAGDVLLVQCDYTGTAGSGVTDSAKTVYTQVGAVNKATGLAQFVSLSAPLAAAATTVTCPAGTAFAEIYIAEMAAGSTLDSFVQANGATSAAAGTVTSTAGDTVVGFCISGTCAAPSGWTAFSVFDSNVVASVEATGASTAASFSASAAWVLTLVSMKAPPVVAPPALSSASLTCTPSFPGVTFSTFVPAGAKGYSFSVLNSGTVPLVISTISPPSGFAMSPVTLPVTIAVGDSQTFTILFKPTSAGTFAGNVVFLANVPTGNFAMGVQGVAQ